MAMLVDPKSIIKRLTKNCTAALEAGVVQCVNARHYEVTLEHVMLALLDDPNSDIAFLVMHYDLDPSQLRATLQRAPTNDLLRENLELSLRALRRQVEQMFAPELDALSPAAAREVAGGLDVLLGFPSIEHLRRTRGLSGPESRRIVTRAVVALLDAPA